MNERIQKLAEQAGFTMWQDEDWNPGDIIDWSASYDKELSKFAELLIIETMKIAGNGMDISEYTDKKSQITNQFGVTL